MICLFSLIFIMPILIKFPTRCPKGLDRSVYSHLVCSIMALQVKRGGPEGWPEWREQQRSALRQPTFMLGYSRACVVICRVIGISFYPFFDFFFLFLKKTNELINRVLEHFHFDLSLKWFKMIRKLIVRDYVLECDTFSV